MFPSFSTPMLTSCQNRAHLPQPFFTFRNRINPRCRAHPTILKSNGLEKVNQPEGNLIWEPRIVKFLQDSIIKKSDPFCSIARV